MTETEQLGRRVKTASQILATAPAAQRNAVLTAMAEAIWNQQEEILAANQEDIAAGRANGLNDGLVDRLTLTEERIESICQGILQLTRLEDPIGVIESGSVRPNGLRIEKVRVPLGAVGMIYESRPNVTADAGALCLKSGNAALLRGGKEALCSNRALIQIMRQAISSCGLPEDALCLIEDPSRESAREMMGLTGILDVLIPRGGAGLIRTVVENAKVPVIETGVGNCHIYIEKTADREKAVSIAVNAKTSRVSVCNAAESLLIDEAAASNLLPLVGNALLDKGVTLYGCPKTKAILPSVQEAAEEDYGTEYLDYKMSVKVVSGLEEAIAHINRYGTGHSEAIVTENYTAAERFLNEVDAAAVYVNASTRFTDGGEFGLGAEIGISTQKLHVRGPMGLTALTTQKYRIYGSGQIR